MTKGKNRRDSDHDSDCIENFEACAKTTVKIFVYFILECHVIQKFKMNLIAKISLLSEELNLKKMFKFLNFRRLKNCVIEGEGEEVKYSTIYKVSSIKQSSEVSKTKK